MSRLSCNGIMYTFRQNDSIYAVSRRYNLSIASISRENPWIDIYNLSPGDEICLPIDIGHTDKVIEYTVMKNDTILQIITKFDIDLDALLKYNDLDTLKLEQGMRLQIPVENYE